MMWKYTIQVNGMMCGMCESHVNDAVRKAFPVKKVTSSRGRNETTVFAETELDEDFRRWILDFPRDQLPVIYSLLEKYRPGREIHVFRTRAEAEGYHGSLGPPRDWSTRFSAG